MSIVYQKTVKKSYCFQGKGLHTGRPVTMTINPAPVDFGIRFKRTDIGQDAVIEALADYVSNTARSTTISKDDVKVVTIEHIMSALTGLAIDNALIELDNIEVPILDGSAKPYVEAICADGVQEQDAPRKYVELKKTIEVRDEKTGSYVRIEPCDEVSCDVTIDFNSKVLGVQNAHWDPTVDYANQIGVCRTFCFFHEIEYLFDNNLVKGGDVDNAIVIVEHPVSMRQLDRMSCLFNVRKVKVSDKGYLDNLTLHFENECARHKLLDLMGDMRLAGGFFKAKVTGYKSGHSINTRAARALRESLK